MVKFSAALRFPWSMTRDEFGLRVMDCEENTVYEQDWTDLPKMPGLDTYAEECIESARHIVAAVNLLAPGSVWNFACRQDRMKILDRLGMQASLAISAWDWLTESEQRDLSEAILADIVSLGSPDLFGLAPTDTE